MFEVILSIEKSLLPIFTILNPHFNSKILKNKINYIKMIKNIAFRIIRSRIRTTLPIVNKAIYKKMFTLTYKFFIFLKPIKIT